MHRLSLSLRVMLTSSLKVNVGVISQSQFRAAKGELSVPRTQLQRGNPLSSPYGYVRYVLESFETASLTLAPVDAVRFLRELYSPCVIIAYHRFSREKPYWAWVTAQGPRVKRGQPRQLAR